MRRIGTRTVHTVNNIINDGRVLFLTVAVLLKKKKKTKKCIIRFNCRDVQFKMHKNSPEQYFICTRGAFRLGTSSMIYCFALPVRRIPFPCTKHRIRHS